MHNETVLITGCSSGIGKALALECSYQGFNVIATARQITSLKDLRQKGIACYELDVTQEPQIQRLKEKLEESDQHVDILINNAGYGTMSAMLDLPMKDMEKQFQTNVFSIITVSNAFIPKMIEKGSGKIVNISSVSGILTTPFAGAYCASKAAVNSLCDAYRMELAPFGINVITVQPGAIRSQFGDNASAVTEQLISSNSVYKAIEDAIRKRAQASQKNPSSAEDFAKTLCKHLKSKKPPKVLRIGNGSTLMPLLARTLPNKLSDKVLSKPFKLDEL